MSDAFMEGAVCGGLAAMSASACTHPLDLLKVRLQLSSELDAHGKRAAIGPTVKTMLQREGVRGFYRGLSASLVRQALYSPARFGLFQFLMSNRVFALPESKRHGPSTYEKLAASLISGAFGGLLSSPADLVMVRMQADGRLAKTAQRQYSGILGGLAAVTKEGGISALWRGTTPNIQRAMITTCTQFVSYDFFKGYCASMLGVNGLPLHFVASMMSGVVVATFACPADVIRTRMMNSKKAAAAAAAAVTSTAPPAFSPAVPALSTAGGGAVAGAHAPPTAAYVYAYRSTADCFTQTLRVEGVRGLYKGFLPYYARVAPQVTFMFVFFEQFKSVYHSLTDKQ